MKNIIGGIPFMFRDDNLKSYEGAATKDKQAVSRALSTHYPTKSPHTVTQERYCGYKTDRQ
jgi:hypothetical protein